MKATQWAILIVLFAIATVGTYVLIVGSFTNWSTTSVLDLLLLRKPTLENWRWLFSPWATQLPTDGTITGLPGGGTTQNLPYWFRNSMIVALGTAVIQTLVSMTAGYALARYRVPGGGALMGIMIAQNVVPATALFLPLYIVFRRMGIHGLWGMILPFSVNANTILLTRQFAKGVAAEILDAARVDGANEWQLLRHIGLPLLRPVAGMTFASSFAGQWGNLIWANALLQNPKDWIVAQGLNYMMHQFLGSDNRPVYGVVAAVALLSMILPLTIWLLMADYVDTGIQGLVEE